MFQFVIAAQTYHHWKKDIQTAWHAGRWIQDLKHRQQSMGKNRECWELAS